MDSHIWAMFYAGLVAIRLHPRNENVIVSVELQLCAEIADSMLKEYIRRFPCHGDMR